MTTANPIITTHPDLLPPPLTHLNDLDTGFAERAANATSEATLLVTTATLELTPGRWNWKLALDRKDHCERCDHRRDVGRLTLLANGPESDKCIAFAICIDCAKEEIAWHRKRGTPAFT